MWPSYNILVFWLTLRQKVTRNISTHLILEVLRKNPERIIGSVWLLAERDNFDSHISLRMPFDLAKACLSDGEARRLRGRYMNTHSDGVYVISCVAFIDSLKILGYGAAFCNSHPQGDGTILFVTIYVQGRELLSHLIQAGEFVLMPQEASES